MKVKTERLWQVRGRTLDLSTDTKVMGIINMTPDSFSGDGNSCGSEEAVRQAERFASEGAAIIDVGGESTRPGSTRVEESVEIERVVPVIAEIVKKLGVVVSVDTSKAAVARAAIDAGAEIINDISGLRFDGKMGGVAAETGAGLVLMHSQGDFETMHRKSTAKDIGRAVVTGLRQSVTAACEAGVEKGNICLDIGIGFGKTTEQNLELIRRLCDISDCFPATPVMVGVSRKSFIGAVTKEDVPQNRLAGTIAANCAAILNGADIVRVHDVKAAVDAIRVLNAIRGRG